MEKFFYELTKRNWGAPWHLGLSCILTLIVFGITIKFTSLPEWLYGFNFVAILIVGVINEIYERHAKKALANARRDIAEDMVFNTVGNLLTLFLLWIIV